MKEFNAKRAVLKLTNLRQRGRLSSVVEGVVDGVGPIAAIKNFMGGARPRAAPMPMYREAVCDPACTPAHTIAMSVCMCLSRARLHGAGRRGSVAEELDKAGGGARRRRRAGTRDDAAPPLPSRSRGRLAECKVSINVTKPPRCAVKLEARGARGRASGVVEAKAKL